MNSLLRLFKDSVTHFREHNGARMGAALSYYAVFSIAPLIILIIALVGSIFGTQLAQSSIVGQLDTLIGAGTGDFITALVADTSKGSLGVVGTIVSIATILFGAISVLFVLDASLDELWETKAAVVSIKRSLLRRFFDTVKKKLPAFAIIPIVALLFLFFVAASVFFSLYESALASFFIDAATLAYIEPIVLFLAGTAFFVLMYKLLPDRNLGRRELIIGGAVTALLFMLGRLLIGFYIAIFANTTLYGAAGSLVAFLIWVYYSAQIFFFGASLTYIYSKRYGKLSRE